MKRFKHTNVRFIEKLPTVYQGPNVVDQFRIELVRSEAMNIEKNSEYMITIQFKRIFTNQLYKTFIPSFIFWMLGYSTLFIAIEQSGDRFRGSVTVMLVFVTLLNVVSGELPETSYMKSIDFWFAWHIGILFLITLYHIALQRMMSYLLATSLSRLGSYPHTDIEKNEAREYMSERISEINDFATIIFPCINGVFYGVYFCIMST